jgi:PncC family amidohydrolase
MKDPFNKKLLNTISKALIKKQQTIAVAESVTAGLLQFALAAAPDASKFFQGGITAYNLGQKYKFLSVEPIHALKKDSVSEKVAAQMAIHCAASFKSDWGIGITGYATPVRESGNKLFAYFAICCNGNLLAQDKIISPKRSPRDIQIFYVNTVLDHLQLLQS